MPGCPPRKTKPTLSITDVVRAEKVLFEHHKAMWGDWIDECAGLAGQREGIRERILAELPSLRNRVEPTG